MTWLYSRHHSFIRKCGISLLIAVQAVFFTLPPDVAAYVGESLNHKITSGTISEGGGSRASGSNKVSHDTVNCLVGRFQSQNYRLASGFVHTSTTYNRAPVLSHIGNKSINEAATLVIDVMATDSDGDSLSFTRPAQAELPSGAFFTDNGNGTAAFVWTPTFEDAGNYDVHFEVSDGRAVDAEDIVITVGDINRPPELEEIGSRQTNEAELLEFTVTAADPDGNPITLQAFNLPQGAALTDHGDGTATFSWTPTFDEAGAYPAVRIEASDSLLTDDETVLITVVNVNRAPCLKDPGTPIPDVEASEGDTVVINAAQYYEDPDGQTLEFYFAAPFDALGRWITDYDDAGVYDVKVTVSDTIDTVEEFVRVTVANTNRAPSAALTLSTYTADKFEYITVHLTASDPDQDALTFSLKKDTTEIASGSIISDYETTTSFNVAGDHTISATVTDTGSLTAQDSKGIDVIDPNQSRSSYYPVMGDFNADGVTDLGLHNNSDGTWEISISEDGEFTSAPDWLTGFGDSKDWITLGGDFNGDGYNDIGIYNNTNGKCRVAFSDGANFAAQGEWLEFSSASYDWQPLNGDFNADGKTDFGVYNKKNGTAKISFSDGSSFEPLSDWITSFGGNDESAIIGDFNGDALPDIAIYKESQGSWKVAINDGSQFVDTGEWISDYAANKKILIADFNSDGLVDIGYFEKDTGKWYYAISNGTSFVDKGVYYDGFGSQDAETGHTGDFNGDGVLDMAVFDQNKDGMERWGTQLAAARFADLLIKADNGVGGVTEITYDYASKQDNALLPFPVYVAKSVTVTDYEPDPLEPESYTNEFSYEGGYYSAADREFRGFHVATSRDPITGNYTRSYFHQGRDEEDGALKGQVEKIAAYDGNGKAISEVVNTYEVRRGGPLDSGLGFPMLTEVHTTVYEENLTSVETVDRFTYNDIGNITRTVNEGDIATEDDDKITDTVYDLAYTNQNRVLQSRLCDIDEGVLAQKNFTYDDKGNLAEERDYLDTGDDPVTQFYYDSYGNLTTTINANGRSVYTDYEDIFNQFPQTITNVLGHTITYTYEHKFGLIRAVTDANENTTETRYDSLGRITEEINTYGETVTTYTYPDFSTKITTQLNLTKTEYTDGLARNYKTVTIGEEGVLAREISTERIFSERGLLEAESMPHYTGAAPSEIAYVRYVYDLRGRAVQTMADFPGTSKDAVTTTQYLTPLSTKVIDPKGHAKTIIKDVNNNVIEVIEHTYQGDLHTHYEYDLMSNLVKVTDSQGNVTEVFYDSLGRKIAMMDPDTGTSTYKYDNMGNLTEQRDNKAHVISFVYDDISRLIRKDYDSPSMEDVIYTYDALDPPVSNAIGRLVSVDGGASQSFYKYDKEGRVVEVRHVVDGIEYITATSYDILGRVTSLTYPDGETVTYSYDSNSGLLEKVEGSEEYIRDITYNAQGQIRAIAYGNNTSTSYLYGQDQRLQRILTQNLTEDLQDLYYDFDKAGNLSTLTDNIRSNIRTYQYDGLDRLTRAENIPDPFGGHSTYTYQYDSIGNMTYKSDVGAMFYGEGTAGPHAVTNAGGYSYSYDANGNMVYGRGKHFTYDAENRLTEVDNLGEVTSFQYNHNGNRIRKITDDRVITYIGKLYEVIEEDSGAVKKVKHIFTGSDRSITVEIDESEQEIHTSYYHTDHLGSSNVITDESGEIQSRFEYEPYGMTTVDERVAGPDSRTADYRFTGKELDQTGLYYYGARYYDPELGRFITADSFVQNPMDPQTLNRYTYCRNNPLVYTDPSGHFFFSFLVSIIVGAVIGAVVGAVCGAAMAAIMGGDIGQGALWGAISGALMGGISAGLGFLATGGNMSALSSLSPFMKASIAAVSAFSTSLIVGSMQGLNGSALWRSAGISAGVAFAATYVTASISEAAKSQRTETQQVNDNLAPDTTQTNTGNVQTPIDEKVYKFTLSVKKGGGASGMGYMGNEWGHAWGTLEDAGAKQTSSGFGPGVGAGKEAALGRQYPGIVTSVEGMLDQGIKSADISFTWNISAEEFISTVNYVKTFSSNWSLSVNCADFAIGMARAAGIKVPNNLTTLGRTDPNKLAAWLESLTKK